MAVLATVPLLVKVVADAALAASLNPAPGSGASGPTFVVMGCDDAGVLLPSVVEDPASCIPAADGPRCSDRCWPPYAISERFQ